VTPADEIARRRDERRRIEQRRQRLRRRATVAAALFLLVVAIGAVAVLAGGDGSSPKQGSKAAREGHGARGAGQPRGPMERHPGPVPILMYHSIRASKASDAYPLLFVPKRDFKKQMDWLAGEGYHGVTLAQVYRAWHNGGKLPRRPIVISFDDGYLSQYTAALPILRKLHWPGVLNLAVKNLGKGGLTEHMVKAMLHSGWELAAHTISHVDLTRVAKSELSNEVSGSREILRSRFHVPVSFFCYPSGKFNETVIGAVKAAGYRGATTVNPGLASREEHFTLNRIRVDGGAKLPAFKKEFRARAAGKAAE
jgi:peptidoglycan/xylan/chitin deacetylase (PgdA/CDA1 family)